MTDKQYADMTTIMQFCRIFADQMRKCLINSGLRDKGFGINIDVWETDCSDGCQVTGAVQLIRGYDKPDNDHSEDMEQLQYFGERWSVISDPRTETGSLPTEVCFKERRTFREAVAEERTKPYPPDGLWIGADYRGSDVDYRRD